MFIKKENYCNFTFYLSEVSDNFCIAYFCNINNTKNYFHILFCKLNILMLK